MEWIGWLVVVIPVVGLIALIIRSSPQRLARRQLEQQLLDKGVPREQVQAQIAQQLAALRPQMRKQGLRRIAISIAWLLLIPLVNMLVGFLNPEKGTLLFTVTQGVAIAAVIAGLVRGVFGLIQGLAQVITGR
ncbi:MAG: hypothetical protein Fur005_38390 [Roseiflexaceae bacterium]